MQVRSWAAGLLGSLLPKRPWGSVQVLWETTPGGGARPGAARSQIFGLLRRLAASLWRPAQPAPLHTALRTNLPLPPQPRPSPAGTSASAPTTAAVGELAVSRSSGPYVAAGPPQAAVSSLAGCETVSALLVPTSPAGRSAPAARSEGWPSAPAERMKLLLPAVAWLTKEPWRAGLPRV